MTRPAQGSPTARSASGSKGGPPKRTHCKNGHDLAVTGKQLFTKDGRKNGRACTQCYADRSGDPEYRKRDAASHRKRYFMQQLQAALGTE